MERINMKTVGKILETTPKFNPDVCNGWAVKDMEDDIEWLDRINECIARDFPEKFQYHYIERVSPEEEYQQLTQRPERKCVFDICRNDVYMAKMKFTFEEEEMMRYINIPYLGQGGILYLRGSESTIIPVVGDRVFSASPTGLFVITNRSKFNLRKENWRLYQDEVPKNLLLVDAKLFNKTDNDKMDKQTYPEMFTTTGHYMFCEYGVTETFKKFYGADIIICNTDDVYKQGVSLDDWSVFKSTRIKPDKLRRRDYIPTDICMLVRRDDIDINPSIQILVSSFFYVLDFYPDRMKLKEIDDPDTWRLIMGYAIHRSNENEGKLLNTMDEHLESLSRYIDMEVKTLFWDDEGVRITTFYDMIDYFNKIIEERTTNTDFGSQWGKYLMTKRYLLSPFTTAMVMICFNLTKRRDRLTKQVVAKELGSQLLPTTHLQILKDHGEKVNVQYPGDCMLFKHTCNSVRQENAVIKKNGGGGPSPNDITYHLHVSIFETGSICNTSKKTPCGRTKLNPCIVTNPTGKIVRNKKFIKILDRAHSEIMGENLR